MPLKPIGYGFKAFLLCEAKTGYVLGWKLFTGDPRDVDEDFGLTYKIVRTLCADLTGNNNILYTDRFYTGLQIYTDLKYLGVGACGTIQANRAQLSEEVSSRIKQLTPNEIVYFKSKQGLLLSCWKDSSVVMMLSNCYESGTAETTRRRKRKEIEKLERERELENASEEDPDVPDIEVKVKLNIPISIYDYNKNMSGVDLFDQKAAYYGVLLRSHRWYMKIFFRFLEVSMINAYTIYKKVYEKYNAEPMSHLEFRKDITRDLLEEFREKLGIMSTKQKRKESNSGIEIYRHNLKIAN